MSRRKSKNNNIQTRVQNVIEIDYDKLAEAIVNAHQQIDKNKIIEQERKRKEELKEWHKIVNYREYNDNLGKIKIILCNIRNAMCGFWALINFNRENAQNDFTTFSLLQFATEILFNIIKWFFYTTSFLVFLYAIQNSKYLLIVYSLLIYTFARIFRIASFEIANIKDRQYIIAIFSAITSFIALIIAIIAFFKR